MRLRRRVANRVLHNRFRLRELLLVFSTVSLWLFQRLEKSEKIGSQNVQKSNERLMHIRTFCLTSGEGLHHCHFVSSFSEPTGRFLLKSPNTNAMETPTWSNCNTSNFICTSSSRRVVAFGHSDRGLFHNHFREQRDIPCRSFATTLHCPLVVSSWTATSITSLLAPKMKVTVGKLPSRVSPECCTPATVIQPVMIVEAEGFVTKSFTLGAFQAVANLFANIELDFQEMEVDGKGDFFLV